MTPLVLMSAALAVPIELEATMSPCGELTATARADSPRHPVVLKVGEQVHEGKGTVSWQGNPWAAGHRGGSVSVEAGNTRGVDVWTTPRRFKAAPPAHLSVSTLAHPTRGEPLSLRVVVDTPCPAEGFVVTVDPTSSPLDRAGVQQVTGTDATVTVAPRSALTETLRMSLRWHGVELTALSSPPFAYDKPCPDCDKDGDGVTRAQGDCDDRDGSRYPGNTGAGTCQDIDCDGIIDGSSEPPTPHSSPETAIWLGRLEGGLSIPVVLTDEAPVWLAFLVDQPPDDARELLATAKAPGLHTIGITVFEGPQWTEAAAAPTEAGDLHLRFGQVKPGLAGAYLAEPVNVSADSLLLPKVVKHPPDLGAGGAMPPAPLATVRAVTLDVARSAGLTPDEARAGQSPWQPRAWYVRVHAKWPERACPVNVELFR